MVCVRARERPLWEQQLRRSVVVNRLVLDTKACQCSSYALLGEAVMGATKICHDQQMGN
jgi:hypothetical protein